MARMHKSSRGRSSSHAPQRESAPEWQTLDSGEITETVLKLAREGQSPAVIGVTLRDQYGVPDVRLATGKRMKAILEEGGIQPDIPHDLQALIRKAVSLRDHLAIHRRDVHNARGLQLVESKIRRLSKYYKRMGRIPVEWKYTRGNAHLMVE